MLTGGALSRRDFLGRALAAGAGLAAAACRSSAREAVKGGPTESEEPRRGGTLRLASAFQILSIDPHTIEGATPAPLLYSYMIQATDWQGSVGDLATSWENVDELNWVFHIREDVHFQDLPPVNGRAVSAQDIINSMTRLRSLPGASLDQNIIKYEAPDLRTVTLQTKEPDGYLLMNIGSQPNAVVPIEAVDAFGDLKDHAIGSGPFILDRVNRDELAVVRNPTYYHDYPYVDGINVRALVEAASRQAAFRAGDIDVYVADNRLQADTLKGVPGSSTERYLSAVYSVFTLNAARVEAFKDERTREAIDLALDRTVMIEKLHFGDGELAGPVPPRWDTALPKEEVASAYRRDVGKARQLLSAAGQDGLTFELSFYTDVENADRASIIKDNLAEVGITVNLATGEVGTWLTNLLASNFESTAYTHLPYLSDYIQLQSHHTYGWNRSPQAFLGIEDPEVDSLLDKERQTIDDQERKKLALDAQRLILKRHGPTLVLCEPYAYWIAYDYLKGYTPTAYGLGNYRYNYWLDKG
jgi:peptide/nickel transport system substrate-binding protein